jgi:uncharacterized protein
MIVIDTNLLIYAHRTSTPEHQAARQAIEVANADPRGWGMSIPSLSEFWSVVTHPLAAGRPSTVSEACEFIRSLVFSGAQIWSPKPGFEERLMQSAASLSVTGIRIFDLQIALIALDNGATEIWTHDRQFVSVPGLLVSDPLLR